MAQVKSNRKIWIKNYDLYYMAVFKGKEVWSCIHDILEISNSDMSLIYCKTPLKLLGALSISFCFKITLFCSYSSERLK